MGPDAAVTGRPEGRPLPEHAELRVDVEQRFASGVIVAPVLDVELAPGSILVLFGPSGAGKTTMLRQVAGLERPDRGRIQFGGDTWCDMSRGEWRSPQERRIGMVFQQPALFPHLSVRDNIEYGLSTLVAAERRQRSGELIRLLAIPELADRLPRALSGGEAQRVAVARALAPKPGLVLLDEPFASLDVPARASVRPIWSITTGRPSRTAVVSSPTQVRVAGELWEAISDVPLVPGESVQVTGVDGLTLRVSLRSRAPR